MSSGGGGPGVVERASKEISRRIHSLGFSKAGAIAKRARSQDRGGGGGAGSEEEQQARAAAADKLNGNETAAQQQQQEGSVQVENVGVSSSSSSASASAVGGAASISKMGTIIKGSVMDKVTHVFNSSSMGNSSNKENSAAAASAAAQATAAAANQKKSASPEGSNNGINIPKGAVANGRAKFEAVTSSTTTSSSSSSSSSDKPLRFFSSRSRNNSPLLPVKTPKVPPAEKAAVAAKDSQASTSSSTVASSTPQGTTLNKTQAKTSDVPPVPREPPPPPPRKDPAEKLQVAVNFASSKFFSKLPPYTGWDDLWQDSGFLHRFFWFFPAQDRFTLASVCSAWKEVLYRPCFWAELRPVLHCRVMRTWVDNEPGMKDVKQNYLDTIKQRGFDSLVLLNANDADIFDFIQNFPHGAKHLCSLILRCCNLSDRGLEALMEFLQGLYQLEIAGCNEITEQGLWSSLHPRLVSVTINDCINVADECICAVTQLLPSLYEFNLQAYHVTDSALSYFSPKQTNTLNVLRLQSCWEITNHGIVNIVHTLPNLTMLSLSGCSKVTDDGIELIAENLRKLRCLDVSWCPRVTDAALEYIACDLNHLEELTLDRCVHITDIGIGYISTMLNLHTLYLRWCTQIRDFGLQHICGMRSMQVLSLAGNPLLTSNGFSNLVNLRHLVELELTNCPGATAELINYLREGLPGALVLD